MTARATQAAAMTGEPPMRTHSRDDANTYGFRWGPVDVTRTATFPRDGGWAHVLHIETDHQRIEVYVSPTGRSVRIYRDGKELT